MVLFLCLSLLFLYYYSVITFIPRSFEYCSLFNGNWMNCNFDVSPELRTGSVGRCNHSIRALNLLLVCFLYLIEFCQRTCVCILLKLWCTTPINKPLLYSRFQSSNYLYLCRPSLFQSNQFVSTHCWVPTPPGNATIFGLAQVASTIFQVIFLKYRLTIRLGLCPWDFDCYKDAIRSLHLSIHECINKINR